MAEKTYRVAVIGCGGRGRAHAVGIATDPRCNVVALADVKPETAESLNADFGFEAKIYTDYHELLEREKPDIAVVCLWTKFHVESLRACAEAGVRAILAEKPIAGTWHECLEIGKFIEDTGCQVTLCHQRRFAPGNLLMRRLIDEGAFGKLISMDLYSPPNLLDCGTHTFDQALSFNGEVPAKWVHGALDTSETHEWFGVKFEHLATGQIVFENGVRASYQIGGPDMDLWGGVRVIGTEGFADVMWDGEIIRSTRYDDPAWHPELLTPDSDAMMKATVKNALDCLESGAESEVSYTKAMRAAQIIFGAYASVAQRRRIELPLSTTEDIGYEKLFL